MADEGAPEHHQHRSGPAVWWRFFLGLLCFSTMWSLATPLTGAPDEPNHLIRASALMRGQLVGRPSAGLPILYTEVEVTQAYASTLKVPLCFAFRPTVPAGCSPPISDSAKVESTIIYVGRYPPTYYALVGWPTKVVTDPAVALYLVRLLNGIVSCAFLALAACLALRAKSPRLLIVGVLTAATPMVLFLTALVNPNSLEVSAALCLWTAAILLAQELRTGEVSRSLVRILIVAALTVVLVRPNSPLWVLLVAVGLSPLLVRSGVRWRTAGRRRDLRLGAAAIVAAGVQALLWTVIQQPRVGSNPIPPASTTHVALVRGALAQGSGWVLQAIGNFGHLDAPAPQLTVLIWVTVTGMLILCGFSFGRAPERMALLATIVLAIIVPLVLVLALVRTNGYIGLARYFLALYVGIPIVAAVAMEPAIQAFDGVRRLARTIIVCLVVGHVAAFHLALHRNTVGRDGTYSPTETVPGGWAPPLPALLLYIAAPVLATVATVALLSFLDSHYYQDSASRLDATGEPDGLPAEADPGASRARSKRDFLRRNGSSTKR